MTSYKNEELYSSVREYSNFENIVKTRQDNKMADLHDLPHQIIRHL